VGVEAKNQWVPLRGVLKYDPGSDIVSYKSRETLGEAGLRKKRPRQLIVELRSRDLCRLYCWFYERRYWIKLQEIMLVPHINVLRRQESNIEVQEEIWKKHEGEIISFEYSPLVEQHWKFHVLPIRSERLNEIRTELGLDERRGMHITFGRHPDHL